MPRQANRRSGPRLGIVWFDAHGDLNTADTSPGGFFDGMGLAMATGRTYADVVAAIGLGPVAASRVLHVGARDLDPAEVEYLQGAAMWWVPASALQADPPRPHGTGGALSTALAHLREATRQVYLHVDIDVLTAAAAPGVDFPAPGGLTLGELEIALRRIVADLPVGAAALTAYDPHRDRAEATLGSGLRLIGIIVDALAARESA
jgi:arginase